MQDFLNSVAQEDVTFITQITRTSTPGDNFFKLMIFVEGAPGVSPAPFTGRFLNETTGFVPLETGSSIYICEVTADTYADVTKGLLKSWLADFFANGNMYSCYLVAYGPDLVDTPLPADIAAAIVALEAAYAEVKAYAYHKTICAGGETAVLPDLAVALAELCKPDNTLLSAAPYYPLTEVTDYATDPIYAALKLNDPTFVAGDAFMTAHADVTRNGSLYSLGLALSLINGSGTPVGNNMDFWASSGISPSGEDGASLSLSLRNALKEKNIAFFKLVGDGIGSVVSVGVNTLSGQMMQAVWVVNYINYMCKVQVASFITQPNRTRSNTTYSGIINIMASQLNRFGPDGAGRLVNIVVTAPSFAQLPVASGDEIIVPKAWSAEYTDQIHKVQVYGNLIISA